MVMSDQAHLGQVTTGQQQLQEWHLSFSPKDPVKRGKEEENMGDPRGGQRLEGDDVGWR